MVLFHNIIEIVHLTDDDRGAVLRIVAADGRRIGLVSISSAWVMSRRDHTLNEPRVKICDKTGWAI